MTSSPVTVASPSYQGGVYRASRLAMPARTNISLADVFCFMVPLLQFVRFDLVGEMSLSDPFILAALPLAMLRHPERLRQKPVPVFLLLGFFWFCGQVFTDLILGSSPSDYMRGWSKIALLMANFIVVWVVACPTQRRFVLYTTGLGIGAILSYFTFPSTQAITAPWKFALGPPVAILAMLWAPRMFKGKHLGMLLAVGSLALIDVFEDCRSLAAITVATALYSLFQMSAAKRQQQIRASRLILLGMTIFLGIWGFARVYSHFAIQGVFGHYAQHKLEAQSSGSGGLLLGGRGEILASSQAIIDSPLLGHGSWARDPRYGDLLAQRRTDLGYQSVEGKSHGSHDDLIPTHSFIFGAWVEAGIAGAVFWLYILGFTGYALIKVSGTEPLLPLFALGGFLFIWDIFFSPLGMPTRYTAPFFMAAMVTLHGLRFPSQEF